jgi:hypothetical protein
MEVGHLLLRSRQSSTGNRFPQAGLFGLIQHYNSSAATGVFNDFACFKMSQMQYSG